MPANSPSNLLPDFDTFSREDWKERIAAFKPGGGDMFSLESGEAVLVGVIPWAKRYSFILTALGYSYVDQETHDLRRVLPLFHPWYTFLACVAVDIQPKVPTVNEDGEDPDALNTKIEAEDPEVSFDYAGYKWADVTIKFSQMPFNYIDDEEGVAEYERYFCDISRQGSLDVLSLQNGLRLTFAEGPAGIKNNAPATELGVWCYKEILMMKWWYVPFEFIASSSVLEGAPGYDAAKISAAVGCVNRTEIFGFRPGTLLLHPPTFERFLWPLRTADPNQSAFGVHVHLPFQVFNPEKGVPSSIYYGHNLMPFSGDKDNPDNGKWFYATRGDSGSVLNPPFLPTAEFRDMFTYVDS